MTFGRGHRDEVSRETVVAVIYQPNDSKFLYQYWQEYGGLACLLSGGVENGEDRVCALRREILEETGYLDFEIVGQLGAEIESHYTKPTGEKLVKHITPFLVSLSSDSRQGESKEEDERFENIFDDSNVILEKMNEYELSTDSSLADHKEILARGVALLGN